MLIDFIGVGPGAPDLITIRGASLIKEADVIIYSGSLINKEILDYARSDCRLYDSAGMTLEEMVSVMKDSESKGLKTVRLHPGDPSLYGAIGEQFRMLEKAGIEYSLCPGVSSMFGASAALKKEYTAPGISQSVIICRMEGRTPVPPGESIESLAAHNATMVIFLSSGMEEKLSKKLIEGGYSKNTPAAIVYKATWYDEKVIHTTVGELGECGKGIDKMSLIIVGDALGAENERSLLYSPEFSHKFRKGDDR